MLFKDTKMNSITNNNTGTNAEQHTNNNRNGLNSNDENDYQNYSSFSNSFFFYHNDNEEDLVNGNNDIEIKSITTSATSACIKAKKLTKKIKANKIKKENVLMNIKSENENENDQDECSTSSSASYSVILKAINKRKLKLSCPLCSSIVLNMSDHLVKKHQIRDRSKRKSYMDIVRKNYLINEKSSATVLNTINVNSVGSQSLLSPASSDKPQFEELDYIDENNNSNNHNNNNDRLTDTCCQENHQLSKPLSNISKNSNNNLKKIRRNSNRKLIKCPICKDDKYFVNISDHLIKIHHMESSEKRKPILKTIKQNPFTYSISYDNGTTNSNYTNSANRTNNSFNKLKKIKKMNKLLNKRRASATAQKLVKAKRHKSNHNEDESDNNQNQITSSTNSGSESSFTNFHIPQSESSENNSNNLVFIDKIIAEDSIFNYPNLDTPNNQNLLNFISDQQLNTELANNLLLQSNLDNLNGTIESNDLSSSDRLTSKRNSLVFLLEQQRKILFNYSTINNPIIETPSSSSLSTSLSSSSMSDISTRDNLNSNYSDENFINENSIEANRFDSVEKNTTIIDSDKLNKEAVWSKLTNMENRINETMDSFNAFSNNIIRQIKSFSNQLLMAYNEIKSLKSNLLQSVFEDSFLNNQSSYSNQSNPLTPKSDMNSSQTRDQKISNSQISTDLLAENDTSSPTMKDEFSNNIDSTLIHYDLKKQITTSNHSKRNSKIEETYDNVEDDDASSSSSLSVQSYLKNINDLEKYKNMQLNQHQQSIMVLNSYLENFQNSLCNSIDMGCNKSNGKKRNSFFSLESLH